MCFIVSARVYDIGEVRLCLQMDIMSTDHIYWAKQSSLEHISYQDKLGIYSHVSVTLV